MKRYTFLTILIFSSFLTYCQTKINPVLTDTITNKTQPIPYLKLNRKYTYVDYVTKKLLTSLEFDRAEPFQNDLNLTIIGNDDIGTGLIDRKLKIILDPIDNYYTRISKNRNLYLAVSSRKKISLILNDTGKILLKTPLNINFLNNNDKNVPLFSYEVEKDNNRLYGIINLKGEILVPAKYNDLYVWGNSLIATDLKGNRYLLNSEGKQVTPSSKIISYVYNNQEYTLLFENNSIQSMKENSNYKSDIIEKSKLFIENCPNCKIVYESSPYYVVRKDYDWGIIRFDNNYFKFITSINYYRIFNFMGSNKNVLCIMPNNNNRGVIRLENDKIKTIVPPGNNYIGEIEEGSDSILVLSDDSYVKNIVDTNGVILFQGNTYNDFNNKVKIKYIDISEAEGVFGEKLDKRKLNVWWNEACILTFDGTSDNNNGLGNKNGKIVSPNKYDRIEIEPNTNLFKVYNKPYMGEFYIDNDGYEFKEQFNLDPKYNIAISAYGNLPDAVRGQYGMDLGYYTGTSYGYYGSMINKYLSLTLEFDSKTKLNTCWQQVYEYKQVYNPDLIRNGVNLSNQYESEAVKGTYKSGSYKINNADSSITFIWKSKSGSITEKSYFKTEGYNFIIYSKQDSDPYRFVKNFNYNNGKLIKNRYKDVQSQIEEQRNKEK
jgi:hypothetical protein